MLLSVKKFKVGHIVSFLFLLGLAKALLFSNFGLKMLGDDGQNFSGAVRLLSGDVIYRDYQAFFPPFADYLLSYLLKLSDFSIVGARYFYSVVVAFLFPVLFLVTKRIASLQSAFFVSLAFIFADTRVDLLFPHTFLLGSFLMAIKFVEKERPWLIFFSGILYATGSLFRPDFALGTALAICALFVVTGVKNFVKHILIFAAFPVVANGLTLFWLQKEGLILSAINHILAGIGAKAEYGLDFFSPNVLFPRDVSFSQVYTAFNGWLYLVWIIIFVSFLYFFFARKKSYNFPKLKKAILVALLVQIFVSLFYLRSQFDLAHFVKGNIAFFPLLALAMSQADNKIFRSLSAISLTGFFLMQVGLSFWFISFNNSRVHFSPGGRVFINREYVSGTTLPSRGMVEEAIEFLRRARQNEPVFVAPYLSMLYFLASRENPTIYDNLLKGYLFEPFGQEYVIDTLEKKRVHLVVYDRETGPRREGGSRLQDYYPRIDKYLMDNFSVVEKNGSWLFMKRRNE